MINNTMNPLYVKQYLHVNMRLFKTLFLDYSNWIWIERKSIELNLMLNVFLHMFNWIGITVLLFTVLFIIITVNPRG